MYFSGHHRYLIVAFGLGAAAWLMAGDAPAEPTPQTRGAGAAGGAQIAQVQGGTHEDQEATYQDGLAASNRGDYDRAEALWLGSALAGHAKSQYEIGQLYLRGRGREQNYDVARQWFDRAAQLGHADAYGALGFLYENGFGVDADAARARALYEQGANLWSAYAQTKLGNMLVAGAGGPVDHAAAARWYQAAADQNHPSAQFNLGLAYETGEGVPQGYDLAAHWYGRAADQGSAIAHYRLGLLYENGQGVARDLARAQSLFATAAQGLEGAPKQTADGALARVTAVLTAGDPAAVAARAEEIAGIVAEINAITVGATFFDELELVIGGPATIDGDGTLLTRVLWCDIYAAAEGEECASQDAWVADVDAIPIAAIDLETLTIEDDGSDDEEPFQRVMFHDGREDQDFSGELNCLDAGECDSLAGLIRRLAASADGAPDDVWRHAALAEHAGAGAWISDAVGVVDAILEVLDVDPITWWANDIRRKELAAEIEGAGVGAVVQISGGDDAQYRGLRSVSDDARGLTLNWGTCAAHGWACGESATSRVAFAGIDAATITVTAATGPDGAAAQAVVFNCAADAACTADFADTVYDGFIPCRAAACDAMADHLRALVSVYDVDDGTDGDTPVADDTAEAGGELDSVAQALARAPIAEDFGALGAPGKRQVPLAPNRLGEFAAREVRVVLTGGPARTTLIYYVLGSAETAARSAALAYAPAEAASDDGGFTLRQFTLTTAELGDGAEITCASRPLEETGAVSQVRCAYTPPDSRFHVVVERADADIRDNDRLRGVMGDLALGIVPALRHLATVAGVALPAAEGATDDDVTPPAIDPAFVGAWEFFLPEPQGVARLQLDFRGDGTYAFTSSSPTFGPHSGTYAAADGRWHLSSPIWSDAGSYQVLNNDNTLVLDGKLPPAAWSRVR